MLQIWGKRADQNLGPFLPPGPRWSNLTQIFILFNTQPNRPRASPASFKPGPLLKGLQIWGKQADQNLGPFLPPGPRWSNLTKIFSLFNIQPNRPRASPASFKHVGQVLYSRGFKLGKTGRSRSAVVEFGLFNTQPNRPRASPASFKHVGQVLYSRGFKFGKTGRSKFGSIFASRSAVVEFDQNV